MCGQRGSEGVSKRKDLGIRAIFCRHDPLRSLAPAGEVGGGDCLGHDRSRLATQRMVGVFEPVPFNRNQDVLLRVDHGGVWWMYFAGSGPIPRSSWPAVHRTWTTSWCWRIERDYGVGILDQTLVVPLWIPFLVIAVLTAYL